MARPRVSARSVDCWNPSISMVTTMVRRGLGGRAVGAAAAGSCLGRWPRPGAQRPKSTGRRVPIQCFWPRRYKHNKPYSYWSYKPTWLSFGGSTLKTWGLTWFKLQPNVPVNLGGSHEKNKIKDWDIMEMLYGNETFMRTTGDSVGSRKWNWCSKYPEK